MASYCTLPARIIPTHVLPKQVERRGRPIAGVAPAGRATEGGWCCQTVVRCPAAATNQNKNRANHKTQPKTLQPKNTPTQKNDKTTKIQQSSAQNKPNHARNHRNEGSFYAAAAQVTGGRQQTKPTTTTQQTLHTTKNRPNQHNTTTSSRVKPELWGAGCVTQLETLEIRKLLKTACGQTHHAAVADRNHPTSQTHQTKQTNPQNKAQQPNQE